MADFPLEAALDEAYRTWSTTGHATVQGFDAGHHEPAALTTRLAELEAIDRRCVISSTKAAWLRSAIA